MLARSGGNGFSPRAFKFGLLCHPCLGCFGPCFSSILSVCPKPMGSRRESCPRPPPWALEPGPPWRQGRSGPHCPLGEPAFGKLVTAWPARLVWGRGTEAGERRLILLLERPVQSPEQEEGGWCGCGCEALAWGRNWKRHSLIWAADEAAWLQAALSSYTSPHSQRAWLASKPCRRFLPFPWFVSGKWKQTWGECQECEAESPPTPGFPLTPGKLYGRHSGFPCLSSHRSFGSLGCSAPLGADPSSEEPGDRASASIPAREQGGDSQQPARFLAPLPGAQCAVLGTSSAAQATVEEGLCWPPPQTAWGPPALSALSFHLFLGFVTWIHPTWPSPCSPLLFSLHLHLEPGGTATSHQSSCRWLQQHTNWKKCALLSTEFSLGPSCPEAQGQL
nr:uncharacterized protein LOC123567183 [Macaca fascicularis]